VDWHLYFFLFLAACILSVDVAWIFTMGGGFTAFGYHIPSGSHKFQASDQ
jgi:hypothetical protein